MAAGAGTGSAINSNGTATNNGLCVTAANKNNGPGNDLEACDAAKASAPQWTLETNGNLHLQSAGRKDACSALAEGHGPATAMFAFKSGAAGANEELTLTAGQLCSTQHWTLQVPVSVPAI